ncbi:longitudinals lacking protein, isoforms H/M/V isoform X21 [Anabrus simplex]|uniref:longitudinals lacking protein, isoforms H/M/V isoform X21 n=1 Tax=Anabrus simplex TaxID=316456 RepID=UPI0034DD33C6
MGTEQQFCLRWNNHQSTLVAVFDTLLESGTLVDCTLAAEGQYLKAHKVVLSACSPYFELLLSQHYEKHPIVILKDVKFQELKAMMDYMYRGEVNISQDQLGALLKAAESLQIKGLSDSGGGGTERETSEKRHDRRKEAPPPPPPRTPPILPHSSGLTIEHRRPVQQSAPPPVVDLPEDSPPPPRVSGSREGSVSPVPRKRKRHRRRSSGGDDSAPILSMTESRETSSSCELPPQSSQTTAPSNPAAILPVVPVPSLKPAAEQQVALGQEEQTESEILNRPLPPSQPNVSSPQTMPHEPEPAPAPKVEPPSELLEPKAEYLDDANNEDSVEDLTLDDDMDEMDKAQPGPSHGGEGSSSQGGGYLGQLYSLIQRHVPPPLSLDAPHLLEAPQWLPVSPKREAADLTGDTVDCLLRSLAGDVMFRKYSVHNVTQALEAVLKKGSTVSQASIRFGIKRSTLQFYLKKLNIVMRKSV